MSELVDPLSVVAVLPRCFEVSSAAPVLSVALDRVDGLPPFDVAVLLDADLAVFVESFAEEPELDDGPDASAEAPLEAGAAQATCWPVKNAAPIPRATASPPTRPTYLAALNGFSLTALGMVAEIVCPCDQDHCEMACLPAT